jgi:hypothetical protein
MRQLKKPCLSPFILFPLVVYFLLASIGLGLGQLNHMKAGFFPFTLALALLFLLFLIAVSDKKQSRAESTPVNKKYVQDVFTMGRILQPFVIFAVVAYYFNSFTAAATALLFMAATLQRISLKARLYFLSGLCAALFVLTKTFSI